MGLDIRTLRKQQEADQDMAMYTAPEKLWHNDDRTKIVKDGDPEAAHLLLARGEEIPMALAVKLGLVKAEKKAGPKPEDKTGQKPEDKTGKKPETK